MFVVYYVVFYFLITKLNLHTLGREDEGGEMKLYSKKEYKEKQAKEKQAHANAAAQRPNRAGHLRPEDQRRTQSG